MINSKGWYWNTTLVIVAKSILAVNPPKRYKNSGKSQNPPLFPLFSFTEYKQHKLDQWLMDVGFITTLVWTIDYIPTVKLFLVNNVKVILVWLFGSNSAKEQHTVKPDSKHYLITVTRESKQNAIQTLSWEIFFVQS